MSLSQPALASASARGGYAWWYVEAHDTVEQRFGLTLIMFAGSVFSPHYADRLRRGEPATGLDHPAVNFALYERGASGRAAGLPSRQRLWVMNEYAPSALRVSERRLAIQDSFIDYGSDGKTHIELHEHATRFFGRPGQRLDARLTVTAPPPSQAPLELGRSAAGQVHYWQPLAVAGEVDVELTVGTRPLRFRGVAYCDRNFGSGRLEDCFHRWSWAHGVTDAADGAEAQALVLYHAERLDGGVTALAVHYERPAGPPRVVQASAEQTDSDRAGGFFWLRVPRRFTVGAASSQRLDGGALEDTPFYARYAARLSDAERSYLGVGEYLDLRRFRGRAVQRLLTYKTRKVEP